MGPFPRALPLFLRSLLLLAVTAHEAAGKANLTRLLRREARLLTTVSRLDTRVSAAEEELEDLEQEQKQLLRQISEARRRVAILERRSAERHRHLKRRVRGLYKLSRGGLTRRILDDTGGDGDLARQIWAARLVLRRDARELKLYGREQIRLEQDRQQLTNRLEEGARMRQRLARQRQELQRSRAAQMQLLRSIRRNRKSLESLDQELNQQQQRLRRRVARLTYKMTRSEGFAAHRGRLDPPVHGKVIGKFGHKIRVDGRQLSILRHGITYRARKRARVRAVADGTVRLAAPFDGYGQLVLLEHPGGYFTLYGHLSRVRVTDGTRVESGEALGRAGRDPLTGRWGVYFELRRGKRPLDPTDWLRR